MEGSVADHRIDMKVEPHSLDFCVMLMPHEIVDRLRELGTTVTITPEIRRYLQDVVTFMRLERGVAGGVSPHATVLFELLAKSVYALVLNYFTDARTDTLLHCTD